MLPNHNPEVGFDETYTDSLAQAQTVAANMFVFGELFYLFNCRSLHLSMWRIGLFSNRLLLAGVGMMVLFQLAFTYLPVMQVFFATAPLSLTQWGQILASALLIYAAVGVHKWWQQRSRHHGAR